MTIGQSAAYANQSNAQQAFLSERFCDDMLGGMTGHTSDHSISRFYLSLAVDYIVDNR